ncbi:MAG: methyltransferase domain-containing protein [Dolichospermum sp. LBC05a]|nr:methyltransferase domain-containing protein [Dolichospermum sp. OL01]MCO5795785.1 methyltransferase domain-containing protein [Dolichospermum sp. OL03]MCS6281870.1 methyltransferase domain-containing protein [Dolichospermum sp.]QSV57454.1 MAG: methyltransferase domain-containing protein [Dolichospermum sp. LBC05a]
MKMLKLGYKIKKLLIYVQYDSSEYWKARAKEPQQAAVLWTNQEYNQLYRNIQVNIIKKYLSNLKDNSLILDIGCGIGIVAKMIIENHPTIQVDAVDFPEMIQVAKNQNLLERINYVENSAEKYLDTNKKYHLIVSSGCFSAIRNIEMMKQAVLNSTKMIDKNGIILMIDPFHKWNYLARVKFNSKQMISMMKELGFELVEKNGVLFWPYRDLLANSKYNGTVLERKFQQGEWLLSKLGQHFWADYKILAFRKKDDA